MKLTIKMKTRNSTQRRKDARTQGRHPSWAVPENFHFLSAPLHLRAFALILYALCGYNSPAQTNQPAPVGYSVMVNSNGVVIAPANFAAANGFGTNGGGGLSTNLAPAKIFIGNTLSNATAQAVSGDLALSTNGVATLTATGTAGTYAQATFDGKGRETSGATVLPINAGGTGQTAASAALAALGGIASVNGTGTSTILIGPTLEPANGGASPQVVFPATTATNGDQPFLISGSPWTSGAGVMVSMKMTNVNTPNPSDVNGYYNWDPLALALVVPGFQSVYGNLPGVDLLVANNEPIVIAGSSGLGNKGMAWFTSDAVNGKQVLFPFTGSSTNNRAAGISYNVVSIIGSVTNTNTVSFPADQALTLRVNEDNGTVTLYQAGSGGLILANGVTLSTTNGLVVKANGTLNNSIAFDAADTGPVHHDDAVVTGTNFVATRRSQYGFTAFDASGTGSGVSYQLGNPNGVPQTEITEHGYIPMIAIGNNKGWIGSYNSIIVGGTDGETTNTAFGGNNNSVFQIMGSLGLKVVKQTGNYSDTVDDEVVLMNGSTLTNTLPDATSACTGRIYTIKLIANSSCVVNTTSSQHIDASTSYSLSAQYKYVTVQSDGTQWWIIANN
jgi:hypothetical protein